MAKKEENKILGCLEEEIMKIIWKIKEGTVRDVLKNIKREKKPAYTTIMTVMNRLEKKGILKRKLQDDSYVYKPTHNKESFLALSSKKIIDSLFKNFGEDLAIAQFMDHLEKVDTEKSKELKQKLKKIIK